MSVKVDVSVRAEDGSVRSFRDISPPRDGRTGDLFSGVEELIRGLLEPTAAGGGRRLTNTPTIKRKGAISQTTELLVMNNTSNE
ncbi:hypothetical protein FJT64_022964 [Amphibalanus amphitrite]|uniref:Uncharacterized protein n=1 Tax=Amphibalanus amphitrite TaxID=1232801 RepID=A0A6A4WNX2_AMPAM|nr:hypothetical protein FJT64_022964 [Amphibalanus amphitrite]